MKSAAKLVLGLLGVGTVVGGAVAVAHASSKKESTSGQLPSYSPTDLDTRALNAIATGLADRCTAVAVELMAAQSPQRAGALNQVGTFYREMGSGSVPADVGGQATAAVRTLSPEQIRATSVGLQSRYPTVAASLQTIAQVIDAFARHTLDQTAANAGSLTSTSGTAGSMTQAQVSELVANALQSGSPQQMTEVAQKLRAAGYSVQASGLEAAANVITQAQVASAAEATAAAAQTAAQQQAAQQAAAQQAAAAASAAAAAAAAAQQQAQAQQAASQASQAASSGGVPAQVITDVANALASRDPKVIRALSAKLRAQGYTLQADSLDIAAAGYEAAAAAAASAAASQPTAATQTPSLPTASSAPAVRPEVTRAQNLLLKLKSSKKGDSGAASLVKQFQIGEGLSKQDGSYGTQTALTLAQRYGLVPVVPWYVGAKSGNWNSYVADAKAYNNEIDTLAAADPQRSDEWTKAKIKKTW
jgi:hypothetical protein